MNNLFIKHFKTSKGLLVILAACVFSMQTQAQQGLSTLQLADKYFAAAEYLTAAGLYEQFLHPQRSKKPTSEFALNVKGNRMPVIKQGASRMDIVFKQAESYRLANYWEKAAIRYKVCAKRNSGHEIAALYWYAVCQRSLGNYKAAEKYLNKVLSAEKNTGYKADAEKELQTLRYIRQQLLKPDSILIPIQKLKILGSDIGAFAPVYVSGDQFLISSSQADSGQANGINPNHSRLFYATLNDGGLEKTMQVALSSAGALDNQGTGSISADGNYLYYSQWKIENGRTVSSIYYAVKGSGGWTLPLLLPLVNVDGYNSKHPFCLKDGKYLFFASDRPGGSGKFDIWYAVLKKDGTTGQPVNAGPVINTMGDEQAPFYQNSSTTLVFSSNSLPGMGGYDLFSAIGNETTWTHPENMGYPVNSTSDDIHFFAPEKTTLLSNAIVSSDRGTGCCLESYSIGKAVKHQRLTGIVRDCRDSRPVANAIVILRNASGKTREATTDAEGKYVFDQLGDAYQDVALTVNKDQYKETVFFVKPRNIDKHDLTTDKILNSDVCLEMKLDIKAENVVIVYFDFDQSILKEAAIKKLDSLRIELFKFPAATIQISGFTDNLGTEEYNEKLSDRRAKVCADYLTGKGIRRSRISFQLFDACCPVDINGENGYDRRLHRRALINVKKD